MRRLLAMRDARLLLLGETLSMFGNSAMFLVLAIWVKSLTGSNAAAGLVIFVLALPALAAPLGGLLVDRVRRRPLMIWIDLLAAAAVSLLLLVDGRGDLWIIYLVAGLYGAALVVFGSAQSALLTVMLPTDVLAEANGVFQTVREGLRLLAPLAGAGLYTAFGGGAVALVDAGTFAASAACLAAIRTPERRLERTREHRLLTEIAAGVRHVQRTAPLREIVLTVAVALLVVGFTETLIFAVVDEGLHRAPAFLGILGAAQGVGAVLGGLTAARTLRRIGDAHLVGVGIALFAAGGLGLATPYLALVLLGNAIAGTGVSWVIVGFMTAIQLRSPAHLQGRVYSAANALVGTPQTFSIALGAALSTLVDYRILLLVMAAVLAGSAAYLLTREVVAPAVAAETAG